MTNNIAFIPLKTFSRRLPKKNFKKLLGHSIFNYAVDAALKSKIFSKIFLSTDNPTMIRKKLSIKNDKIEILERNDKESAFNLSIKEVMHSQLLKYKNIDNVCLIYPTAALITKKKIVNSFDKLSSKINSVIGVSKVLPHPNRAFSVSNGKIFKLVDEKNMDPLGWKEYYASNGSISWVKFKKFKEEKSFYIEPMNFEIFSLYEHLDIDNEDDFIFIKKIIEKKL